MGLAERVTAGDEGHGLLVVHRHPTEGLADVAGGGHRVRLPVGALRVDVDQAHLDRAQRAGQLAVTAVALVPEPGVLGAPEDLLRLPDVLAPETEAEGLEAHRLEGAVAGEHQEVGPGDLLAVLLLDRPQQPTRLVEVGVVGPAVQGREPLGAVGAAAAAVLDAVGAGGVPAHPDEEWSVVPVVGRPPVLRRRHQLEDVALERLDVEALELVGVAVDPRPSGWTAPSAGAAPAGSAGWATSPGWCADDSRSESGWGWPGSRSRCRARSRRSLLRVADVRMVWWVRSPRRRMRGTGPGRRPPPRRSCSRGRRRR